MAILHPLLHLIATQPQLLADHAEAYADLAASGMAAAYAAWKRRTLQIAAALCCTMATVVLAGFSLMLWAVTPPAALHAPWVLWTVPMPTLAAAAWCLLAARTTGSASALEDVKRQLSADMAMLRSAGT